MKNIALLILGLGCELVKRPVAWVVYPFAYPRRVELRASVGKPVLWYFLDDTIHNENLSEFGVDADYCTYGKKSAFVEKFLPFDSVRSWYWSAWRNSAINLMVELEQMVGPMQRPIKTIRIGTRSFYEVGKFLLARELPYLEFWIGSWRLQAGWLTCGRWQLQFRNLG